MEKITKLVEKIEPYIGIILTILTGMILLPVLFSGMEVNIFTVFAFIGTLIYFYNTCKLWFNTRKKGE